MINEADFIRDLIRQAVKEEVSKIKLPTNENIESRLTYLESKVNYGPLCTVLNPPCGSSARTEWSPFMNRYILTTGY